MGLLFYKALTATRFISLNKDIATHGIHFQLVMGKYVSGSHKLIDLHSQHAGGVPKQVRQKCVGVIK